MITEIEFITNQIARVKCIGIKGLYIIANAPKYQTHLFFK